MKILFDARHIEDVYSGLARYTFSVLNALMESDLFDKLEIIFSLRQKEESNPLLKSIKEKINEKIRLTFLDAPLFKFQHHIRISRYVNSSDCDLFFYPHFDLPFGVKKKSVFVVHDLLPLVVDNYILKHKRIKQFYFRNIIKFNLGKANTTCVAVSESTKRDILEHIGSTNHEKIKVVYESSFSVLIDSEEKNSYFDDVVKKKFLLYIGTRRPHKNLKKMVDSYKKLREDFKYQGDFIIAGSVRNYDFNLEEYVDGIDGVCLIGKVSDTELLKLYKKMDALFFLSSYEGFGLPIIEAATLNKRIITSSTSSCGEIAPSSALLLNPNNDETSIAQKINLYLNESKIIDNSEYLKGFSWEKTVAEIF